MGMAGSERRLAAVLAVDMVGFSRLMEIDETGTLARLKTHRIELIDPAIANNRGRIIKTTGDGMLVEFHSIVDAVLCAAEIQRRMARRNADIPPARWMQFRIGINLGDLIFENDDIFGDGVNIAARLETLAEPGGICVSGAVRDRSASGWKISSSRISATRVSRTSHVRSASFGSGSSQAQPPRRRRRRRVVRRSQRSRRSP
jgi:adenylate cyclase